MVSRKPKDIFRAREDSERVGVIDIGSNSVRLVIFDVSGRSIRAFFNEKVLAGLGRGLSQTKRLHPEGKAVAYLALERFCAVMKGQRVSRVSAFATAAVRDSEDGAEFCAQAKERYGLSIRILSGADEARFAATGVIAMQPDVDGVSGDLGGSSLELSQISSGYYTGGSTYPLGPLALTSATGAAGDDPRAVDLGAARKYIDGVLADAPELKTRSSTFYTVGGAWRLIARLHMQVHEYPLHLLQNYEMDRNSLSLVCDHIIARDRKLMASIDEINARRQPTLHLAALVLKRILALGKFETIIASSHGVREGMVFDNMSPTVRREDPLAPGMRLMMRSEPASALFGEELSSWISQAAESLLPKRLVEAACIVADIGARLHPDHRADMAFKMVFAAPVTGLTHRERAILGLAIGCRYQRQFRHSASEAILSGQERSKAKALGALMRLGADFSGRTAELFEAATLKRETDRLVLDLSPERASLSSELVVKRLSRAAQLLGLEPELRVDGDVKV